MGTAISAPVDLDAATRVEGAEGRYRATLTRAWEIWGPNGGYLAAIAMRAAADLADIKAPASLYCHFLSVASFADVDLQATVLKRGRRSESFSVRMTQDGKPILEAMVRTAADAPGYAHQVCEAPRVPAPEALKSYDELGGITARYPFWRNIEGRPVEPWSSDPGHPVTRDWMRFRPRACFDDPFVDAARSLILLDTFGWPAAVRAYPQPTYLAPNLDTSAWFHRGGPHAEWLLIEHECPIADRGLMGVSGRVWDRDGRLLASGSAQLCCVPAR